MILLNRILPAVLLTSASVFGGTIGSLTEASNTNTDLLIQNTSWGLAGGSYVLTYEQTSTGGRSNVSVVPNTSNGLSPSVNVTTAPRDNDPANNSSTAPRPIFITQPNLGFQVILNADFSAYQGPDVPPTKPNQLLLVGITPPEPSTGNTGLSITDVATVGVSNIFLGAPTETNEISTAGSMFTGDNSSFPTVLTADGNPTVNTGGVQTPTASTPSDFNSTTSSTTSQLDSMTGAALATVPEPSTVIGVSAALLGLGWLRRRNRKA
jgi:hypothetical protein